MTLWALCDDNSWHIQTGCGETIRKAETACGRHMIAHGFKSERPNKEVCPTCEAKKQN